MVLCVHCPLSCTVYDIPRLSSQNIDVPKTTSIVPKITCTESVPLYVPKRTCTELALTHFEKRLKTRRNCQMDFFKDK